MLDHLRIEDNSIILEWAVKLLNYDRFRAPTMAQTMMLDHELSSKSEVSLN